MTSLMGARRRAEEFAAAVDGQAELDRVPAGLRELVGVTASLRSAELAAPRADFTASLRERLMTEAETVLTKQSALVLPPRRKGARERRMFAAATAFVVLGGTAGMAAAAQSALPGEALYPIKRGLERAHTDLSVSQDGKGRNLLGSAEDRLAEVKGLLSAPSGARSSQVPATLEDFTAQANQGAELLLEAFQENRDPASILDLRTFAASGIGVLQELAKSAPPEAQDELAQAALALQAIDEQALALCDTCGTDLPALEVPALFLTAADAERALKAATKLPKLDNSHPVVAPVPAPQPDSGTAPKPPVEVPEPTGSTGSKPGPKTDGADTTTVDPLGDTVDGVVDGTGSLLSGVGDTVDGLLDPILGGLL